MSLPGPRGFVNCTKSEGKSVMELAILKSRISYVWLVICWAFVSGRDGNDEIYVMNADGSNPVNLTNHPASDTVPSWSPDGKRIAFSSDRDGRWQIYAMNPDGTNVVRITNHPHGVGSPLWLPDGKRIAFILDLDLYVMNADGTDFTNITKGMGDIHSFSWSPMIPSLGLGEGKLIEAWGSIKCSGESAISQILRK